jgi:hypothetical protein
MAQHHFIPVESLKGLRKLLKDSQISTKEWGTFEASKPLECLMEEYECGETRFAFMKGAVLTRLVHRSQAMVCYQTPLGFLHRVHEVKQVFSSGFEIFSPENRLIGMSEKALWAREPNPETPHEALLRGLVEEHGINSVIPSRMVLMRQRRKIGFTKSYPGLPTISSNSVFLVLLTSAEWQRIALVESGHYKTTYWDKRPYNGPV